jgi:hypothetical protein
MLAVFMPGSAPLVAAGRDAGVAQDDLRRMAEIERGRMPSRRMRSNARPWARRFLFFGKFLLDPTGEIGENATIGICARCGGRARRVFVRVRSAIVLRQVKSGSGSPTT